MDVTPQSLRDVRFREKLRGYHTDDVDAFVARVADVVEQLQQRIAELERAGAAPASAPEGTAEAEESLRRTLVLAQRTADLAIQEARDEATRLVADATAERDRLLSEGTAERERVAAEIDDLRTRVHGELEQQLRVKQEIATARRAALLADVEALEAHIARERERLRIYFSDQLHRLEEGGPSAAARPEMQAPEAEPEAGEPEPVPDASAASDPSGATGEAGGDMAPSDEHAGDAEGGEDAGGAPDASAATAAEGEPGAPGAESERPPSPYDQLDADALEASAEDDPFLAELRQAVTDTSPLGPREDDHPTDDAEEVDLFRDRGTEGGRFGFRRRR